MIITNAVRKQPNTVRISDATAGQPEPVRFLGKYGYVGLDFHKSSVASRAVAVFVFGSRVALDYRYQDLQELIAYLLMIGPEPNQCAVGPRVGSRFRTGTWSSKFAYSVLAYGSSVDVDRAQRVKHLF